MAKGLQSSDSEYSVIDLSPPIYAQLSRDGRWLAYSAPDGDRREVFLRPFPSGGRCQISIDGGSRPSWSGDGSRLFFQRGRTLMVAEFTSGDFCAPEVRRIADVLTDNSTWAAHPDGDRVVYSAPTELTRLELILDFDEQLKRLVPTD